MVKLNKNFQKIINIDIINYKYYYGRYIKYEENGEGKEYNFNGILLFKGYYVNIKMENEMEKELNIMLMVIYFLKVNI